MASAYVWTVVAILIWTKLLLEAIGSRLIRQFINYKRVMINITKELTVIKNETAFVAKLIYKVGNQMRNFKELQLLKGMIRKLNRLSLHKDEEFDPKKIDSVPTKTYLSELGALK